MQVQLSQDVAARVGRTVELLHLRGYCLPASDVARLCVGGPVPAQDVLAAAEAHPHLSVSGDLVHLVGDDAGASARRQATHVRDSPAYWAQATSYVRSLARHCPWIEAVWVAGSMSSGGFEAGDDIDYNLVVQDDTKYLSYLLALALAVPVSWRLRRHVPDRTTPLLPKVVCLNVLWEHRQTRPFVRTDDAMGMELLLARPVYGHAALRGLFDANPTLLASFPQLADPTDPDPVEGSLAGPGPRASALHGLLRVLTRPRWLRRLFDAGAFVLVWSLHAYVRFHRRRRPDVRRHVEEMERHKAPYGILERPGRRARAS